MEGPAHLTLVRGLPNAQEGEAGVASGRSGAAPEPSPQSPEAAPPIGGGPLRADMARPWVPASPAGLSVPVRV